MFPTKRKRNAFTLVELLVVIAIVALLASFILPGLSRAREYAYFTTCKSQLRQIAIGVLMYASDNRGSLQLSTTREGNSMRRIGGFMSYNWLRPYDESNIHPDFVRKIYDSSSGITWTGGGNGDYIGRPRQKGKYLPIEAFWDPVVKVKGWYFGRYDPLQPCATEEQRDTITRFNARSSYGGNKLGYAFFTSNVGCENFQRRDFSKDWHVLLTGGYDPPPDKGMTTITGCEDPYRWTTNNRSVTTSHQGSVWLAACHPPAVGVPADNWAPRRNVSHFGAVQAAPGEFRFNVLHLDGHTHDSVWSEPTTSQAWAMPDGTGRPYGWEWRVPDDFYKGVRPADGFDGSFDR